VLEMAGLYPSTCCYLYSYVAYLMLLLLFMLLFYLFTFSSSSSSSAITSDSVSHLVGTAAPASSMVVGTRALTPSSALVVPLSSSSSFSTTSSLNKLDFNSPHLLKESGVTADPITTMSTKKNTNHLARDGLNLTVVKESSSVLAEKNNHVSVSSTQRAHVHSAPLRNPILPNLESRVKGRRFKLQITAINGLVLWVVMAIMYLLLFVFLCCLSNAVVVVHVAFYQI
jgi:hypothetical protein